MLPRRPLGKPGLAMGSSDLASGPGHMTDDGGLVVEQPAAAACVPALPRPYSEPGLAETVS